MKILYYKYPNEEDESVIVTELPVQRDTSVAVHLEASDLAEGKRLYVVESVNNKTRVEDADREYTLEDIYFLNFGQGEFEAMLPFSFIGDASRFGDTAREKLLALEVMWDE